MHQSLKKICKYFLCSFKMILSIIKQRAWYENCWCLYYVFIERYTDTPSVDLTNPWMSERVIERVSKGVRDCCLTSREQYVTFIIMMMFAFILDTQSKNLYSAYSLKQQPTGGHVAPLGQITGILISRQPVIALTPYCCVLCGKPTNIIFIVFGLTRPGLKLMIYGTRHDHYIIWEVYHLEQFYVTSREKINKHKQVENRAFGENKCILCFSTMYMYCIYPAMPKKLKTTAILSKKSRWCLLWCPRLYYFRFVPSLNMNPVPEKNYILVSDRI
jgi:hypothetical protein